MVGMLLFAVGGGMSILQGVLHLRRRQALQHVGSVYVVLAISFAHELASFVESFRPLSARRAGRSLIATWRESKDPTVLLVDRSALQTCSDVRSGRHVPPTLARGMLPAAEKASAVRSAGDRLCGAHPFSPNSPQPFAASLAGGQSSSLVSLPSWLRSRSTNAACRSSCT